MLRVQAWIAFLAVMGCSSGVAESPSEQAEPTSERRRAAKETSGEATASDMPSKHTLQTTPELSQSAVASYVELGEGRGEDGRGGLVESQRTVAVDIRAPIWPGRAMDPVFEVEGFVFTRYEHPSPDVLRFIISDVGLLPAGGTGVVRYGPRPYASVQLPGPGGQ